MDLKIKDVKLTAMNNEMNTRFHDDFYLLIDKRPGPVVETLGLKEIAVIYLNALDSQMEKIMVNG